jgi:hypothetical protein
MTAHISTGWRRWTAGVTMIASLAVAGPAAWAQQARALVTPYLEIPAGVRFSEIDPRTFGPRAAEVSNLEAFTLPEVDNRTVFINVERPLWRLATADDPGASFYRAVLASIVAHELSHLAGNRSEVAALKEERRVWLRFVRDHTVPTAAGLQRAALLDREIGRAERQLMFAGR